MSSSYFSLYKTEILHLYYDMVFMVWFRPKTDVYKFYCVLSNNKSSDATAGRISYHYDCLPLHLQQTYTTGSSTQLVFYMCTLDLTNTPASNDILTLDHRITIVIVRWEIRVRNLAGISPPATKTIVPAQRTNISSKHENSIWPAHVQTKLLLPTIQNEILHQFVLHGFMCSVFTEITKRHENVSQ